MLTGQPSRAPDALCVFPVGALQALTLCEERPAKQLATQKALRQPRRSHSDVDTAFRRLYQSMLRWQHHADIRGPANIQGLGLKGWGGGEARLVVECLQGGVARCATSIVDALEAFQDLGSIADRVELCLSCRSRSTQQQAGLPSLTSCVVALS